MAIVNSKQDWTTGSIVRIGFMTLTVIALIPTPGDYAPDAYILTANNKFYKFVPHHGLTRIDDAGDY